MGPCIAGGAYLPALSDVILMVEGTSFMGLGGPNLVKGATGQVVDSETLGGAHTHTSISGVAHYAVKDDEACLLKLRELVALLPAARAVPTGRYEPPQAPAESLYSVLPNDHRMPYDVHAVLRALVDGGKLAEFQPERAPEMVCGDACIEGVPVGIIINHRGLIKQQGKPPRIGGIIYTESADKVAFFIERCDREGIPLLFVQDVSGFMVGTDAEHSGIIRAGARFVEAMACAAVPKIVLTINHASGAGYYAMAGQGFDPDFIFSWPTGRMGVMEGAAAVEAVHGVAIQESRKSGKPVSDDIKQSMEEMSADYEHHLDARYAAARGFVDAIVHPEDTRDTIAMALRASLRNPGPHIGAFVLPQIHSHA
jgi:3-methylcrotonyl-CoA carboxylase beta subunit